MTVKQAYNILVNDSPSNYEKTQQNRVSYDTDCSF